MVSSRLFRKDMCFSRRVLKDSESLLILIVHIKLNLFKRTMFRISVNILTDMYFEAILLMIINERYSEKKIVLSFSFIIMLWSRVKLTKKLIMIEYLWELLSFAIRSKRMSRTLSSWLLWRSKKEGSTNGCAWIS